MLFLWPNVLYIDGIWAKNSQISNYSKIQSQNLSTLIKLSYLEFYIRILHLKFEKITYPSLSLTYLTEKRSAETFTLKNISK